MSGEKNQNDSLFTPAIAPKLSAGSLIRVVFAVFLVLAGFWLMGMAFSVPAEFQFITFAAGLAVDTIGFAIAYGFNPASEVETTVR